MPRLLVARARPRYRGGVTVTPVQPTQEEITVIDEFSGTNGATLDATIWDWSGDGSTTIQNNRARSVAPAGYQKQVFRSKQIFSGGELRADFILPATGEQYPALHFGVTGTFVGWNFQPSFGYSAVIQPWDGNIILRSNTDNAATDLASGAITYSPNDVIHYAVTSDMANGIKLWAWVNDNPRPVNPLITSSDTTYAKEGKVGFGVQSGGSLAANFDVDRMVYVIKKVVAGGTPENVYSDSYTDTYGAPAPGSSSGSTFGTSEFGTSPFPSA